MRQGKNIVEVPNRQKLSLAVFNPSRLGQSLALRTMPIAARVVCILLESAGITLLRVPAQIRSPADLYGVHYLKLCER